jgi:hypothetical protein
MRHTQLLGKIREAHRVDQPVSSLSEGFAHKAVYTIVDERWSVYFIVTSRA